MKSRMFTCITVMTLFVVLVMPAQLLAQGHTRYQLVDLGTFGGPNSGFNFEDGVVVNRRGLAVGASETTIPTTPPGNDYDCNGPFTFHAFEWQKGSVIDLGALWEGGCSNARWINAIGVSVGDSENGVIDPLLGINEIRAVLWRNGHIMDLGTLGGNQSASAAINESGQIVGWAENTTPDPFSFAGLFFFGSDLGTQTLAFLWQDGVMQDLGTLGGPDALAANINNRGQVAGNSYTNFAPDPITGVPPIHPFIWENGHMRDLIDEPGITFALVNGLTENGRVIGTFDSPDHSATHPFVWDKGVFTDLGTLGGTQGRPNQANEAGEVVGQSTFPGDIVVRAALWRDGAVTDLGAMMAEDRCSIAWSINSKGQIVGTSGVCGEGDTFPFLWEKGGPMIDLTHLVAPDPSGLILAEAVQINDRGEIAGLGFLPNGDQHAVLLIPCGEGNHAFQDHAEGAAAATSTIPVPFSRGPKTLPRPAHNRMVGPFGARGRRIPGQARPSD